MIWTRAYNNVAYPTRSPPTIAETIILCIITHLSSILCALSVRLTDLSIGNEDANGQTGDRSSEVAVNRELEQLWSSALVNLRIHGVNKVASGAITEELPRIGRT